MSIDPEDTINIDYSGLEPGDEAPDPESPKPSRAVISPTAGMPAAAHAAGSSGSANIIVLSADPTLIELLRESLAGTHRVWRADDAAHAADLLVAAGNAVLLVDASLADHDTHGFVTEVHKQFPELAIIVAGRRDDEAQLAPLVSSGAIFRFLHKPASAERIRNFVDATQRRQMSPVDLPAAPRQAGAIAAAMTAVTAEHPALQMPKLKVDGKRMRRWSRRSLLLVPLLLVWGILEWKPWTYFQGDGDHGAPVPVAATDAGTDPRVLKLLDSASQALAQGRLIEPPGQNALELYRAVLARDPDNRMAQRGIDSVADDLLVAAERALMEQDIVRLASAVDAARSARPDHPRLEFFVMQLERERELQSRSAPPPPAVDAAVGRQLDAAAARTAAGRVQSLLQLANDRMRVGRLVGGKDSAHAHLLAARQLDPADPGVQQGIAALSTQLQGNAQRAIREGRLDEAGNWLLNAAALDVDHARIATLRADLEAARPANVRADRTRLLLLANQRIAQGRLIEPVGDSARHYVDLLQAADPDFEGLADTSALLASRALADARALATAGSADRAEAMLNAAAAAGAPASEITAIDAQIATLRTARAAPPQPAVLPENTLRRTRFVAPEYPVRARERGIEGWVDLEYTVGRDGTTRDVTVRAAEPAGTFDRAAIQAVERWRYEPRLVNNAVVEQRVEARVRFKLED